MAKGGWRVNHVSDARRVALHVMSRKVMPKSDNSLWPHTPYQSEIKIEVITLGIKVSPNNICQFYYIYFNLVSSDANRAK